MPDAFDGLPLMNAVYKVLLVEIPVSENGRFKVQAFPIKFEGIMMNTI